MRPFPFSYRRAAVLATAAFALLLPASAPAAAAEDPWELLTAARQRIEADGAQLWTFRQTYLPVGFDRGEEETGRVALDLPRCVRWDYNDPYPKSFLLCGERLWSWNPGEPVGHQYDVDQTQPGLDLLLLAVGDLESRYNATAQAAGGSTRIQLTPLANVGPTLKDAAILLDGERRVKELTYRDAEGNRTTFRFAGREAAGNRASFTPPDGVRWERDGGG
jgi:outer membrane lipoprotein carrier protein